MSNNSLWSQVNLTSISQWFEAQSVPPPTHDEVHNIATSIQHLCTHQMDGIPKGVPVPPMIPWHVFMDDEINGGLHTILRRCLSLVRDAVPPPGAWLEAVQRVHEELVSGNFPVQRPPKIYIDPDILQSHPVLVEAVRLLRGEIAPVIAKANLIVSHSDKRLPRLRKPSIQVIARCEDHQGGRRALIHTLFAAPTMATWVPLTETQHPLPDAGVAGWFVPIHELSQVVVPLEYLQDSYERFEWLNPKDYIQSPPSHLLWNPPQVQVQPVLQREKRNREELVSDVPPAKHVSHKTEQRPCTEAPITVSYPLPSWFNFETVHDVERDVFSSSGFDETEYKNVRNHIIKAFAKNPLVYLTVAKVRSSIPADSLLLSEIHYFLESWGIINVGVPGPSQSRLTQKEFTNLGGRGHMAKQHLPGEDFVDASPKQPSQQPFTAAEREMLLSALQKYGDSWHLVADEFGGRRTQEECIREFVSLPLAGPSILSEPTTQNDKGGPKTAPRHALPLPFADTSNPIMALLGFLSSMVNPEIAAAAAQAAIHQVANLERQKKPVTAMDMQTTCSAVVGAAQAHSTKLRAEAESELNVVVTELLTTQLQKLESKLLFFETMHGLDERDKLEFGRIRTNVQQHIAKQ